VDQPAEQEWLRRLQRTGILANDQRPEEWVGFSTTGKAAGLKAAIASGLSSTASVGTVWPRPSRRSM